MRGGMLFSLLRRVEVDVIYIIRGGGVRQRWPQGYQGSMSRQRLAKRTPLICDISGSHPTYEARHIELWTSLCSFSILRTSTECQIYLATRPGDQHRYTQLQKSRDVNGTAPSQIDIDRAIVNVQRRRCRTRVQPDDSYFRGTVWTYKAHLSRRQAAVPLFCPFTESSWLS